MNNFGIYTLANDVVYDQLVALINSIEVNVSSDIPICIIPYDERLDKIKQLLETRSNLTLFEDSQSIKRWEDFYKSAWYAHPEAKNKNQGLSKKWYGKSNLFRKMCAFDGKFKIFVFYDADSLAMSPLDRVLEKLNEYDFVFDDWEHKKGYQFAALNFSIVEKLINLSEEEVRPMLHCSSFFGSKQGIFSPEELDKLKYYLVDNQEFTWINERSWWCDADLFSYMTLRCDRKLFNFSLSPNGQDRTGNCADADPFINIDGVLYNQDGLKPIHRLHYMNYNSIDFSRICKGEDVDICYKNEFLYYRFLKEPDKKPKKLTQPTPLVKTGRLMQKIIHKFA